MNKPVEQARSSRGRERRGEHIKTATSEVRIALPRDRHECIRLFQQAHAENGIFTLAPEKVEFLMDRCLFSMAIPPHDTGPRGVIGVIGETGALQALCVLMIGQYWYTHDRHLEEMLVYVDPKHRVSLHARALIKWMMQQSEITGLPLLTGVVSNNRTAAKCALYGRMLTKVGEFYFHRGAVNGKAH